MKASKKISDLIFHYVLFLFTIVTVAAVIMIGVYMFRAGAPGISKVGLWKFLLGDTWNTSASPEQYGILPFILSSVVSMVCTVVITVPVSVLVTIGMSKFMPRAVPEDYMEASLALGVDKEYTMLHIVVPAAKSGILAAVLLGLGRAVGETMAVIMVAGNVPQMPKFLEPVRFLTTAIVTEMSYATEQISSVLMGIGLVLFVFIVVINGIFYVLIKQTSKIKK